MVHFYFTALASVFSSQLTNLMWPTQFQRGGTWSLLKAACHVNVWSHDPAISRDKSEMRKAFCWQIFAVFPHLLMGRCLHLLASWFCFHLVSLCVIVGNWCFGDFHCFEDDKWCRSVYFGACPVLWMGLGFVNTVMSQLSCVCRDQIKVARGRIYEYLQRALSSQST